MKYKFDKSEIIIWSIVFLVTLIAFIFSLLLYDFDKIIYSVILLLLVLASFISYYLLNKYQIKKFNLLCREIGQSKTNVEFGELLVEIKQKKYHTRPLKQSMIVKVDISPCITKAFFILTPDVFIVFFAISEFGFFKKYIKPIVFKKGDDSLIKVLSLVKKNDKMEIHENELLIELKNQVENVEHIIIPAKSAFLEFFDYLLLKK